MARFADMEGALHQEAARLAGWDDFGDPSYLEGLRVLLRAYDEEARLTQVGRHLVRLGVVNVLATRLRVNRQLAETPEVLRTPIPRPIVVCGLVRTGSTALHHVLGRDPDVQVLEYWLATHPQPRPSREAWGSHPDYRYAVRELEAMYAVDPSLKAIHFMEAGGPEECRHFLSQSFTDDGFEVNVSVPSYLRWYEAKHLKDAYLRHRDLLKLVGSTSPQKRWILKYPVHMKNLDALFEVYPDACIVWTHRDPTQVMSSYISLVASFRALFEGEVDRTAIAREQLEVWGAGTEAGIAMRRKHDPARFFDLHFRDFRADPVGAVKRIYAHVGQALSPEGERALRAWRDENPQGRHGRHEHSMEDVGLTRGEILERFAPYMRHFGIEPE